MTGQYNCRHHLVQKNIVVVASTNAGKYFLYQSILLIIEGIILVIFPTIILLENQIGWSFSSI